MREIKRPAARFAMAVAVTIAVAGMLPGQSQAYTNSRAATFTSAISAIDALPYQSGYVPVGTDTAFPGTVLNTLPAEDYTSGSIPDSPDLPPWPASFHQVTVYSADGAPLYAMLSMLPGSHPGIVVVHGFNTHGILSVIRWAAMLAANGYDVLAADQRDYYFENNSDSTYYTKWPQTFGWKESQDVLAAGRYLHGLHGVTSVGIVGFSEGAQNTVLALSQDTTHVFSAGLTFSAPADQDTQIYGTAAPPNCSTPLCTYPVTDALISLVVPPFGQYTDPCSVLNDAGKVYKVTPYSILANESAMHAQTRVTVPLLNFYSADDSLVSPLHAELMKAYESGNALQRTIEIQHGEHAYFFDRWWQQSAILDYFHAMLPGGFQSRTLPTVNQTPAGSSLASQEVAIPSPSRTGADALLAPYICDTSQPPPGKP